MIDTAQYDYTIQWDDFGWSKFVANNKNIEIVFWGYSIIMQFITQNGCNTATIQNLNKTELI